MRRTATRRRRQMKYFFAENRRLFPFVGAYLLGAVLGVAVYFVSFRHAADHLGELLRVSGLTGGMVAGLHQLGSACFSSFLVLAVLFLLGMWPCGAPFIFLIPTVLGMGLGLTEAYYYAMGVGGVFAVAAVILPKGLLTGILITMAGAESLRLSVTLSRRLLSGAKEDGELSSGFRLYCLRFLLFCVGALAVGMADVLFRLLFGRWLP